MPYRNPLGLLYDSGDYAAAQDRAVALADWAGFEARRAEARRRGRYRGIGLAQLHRARTPARRASAREITVQPEGRVDVVLGTLSAGQGHETSFAQLVVEWLGVDARPGAPDHRRHRSGRRWAAARTPAARCGWAGW